MRRLEPVVSFAILATLLVVGSAHAACNSLPTVSESTSTGTQQWPSVILPGGSGGAVPAPELARYRIKGALGRIDGVHFLDGPFRIAADGLCVGPRSPAPPDEPPIRTMGDVRDVAIFVIFDAQPGSPVPIWAYSASENPAATMGFSLAALRAALAERLGHPSMHAQMLPDEWDTAATGISLARGVTGIEVSLPPLRLDCDPRAEILLSLASSAVRIVATHVGKGKNADQVARVVAHYVHNDCQRLCEEFVSVGGLACIDNVYTRVSTDLGAFTYKQDPFLCTVEIPKDSCGRAIEFNDFKSQCEGPTPGPIPSGGRPVACDNAPTTFRFWRSQCGAIHIPLDFSRIRRETRPDGSAAEIVRTLAGRSGVGRSLHGDKRRIFVPGREFVGSTPPHDPSAVRPETKWRFPDIDVWYPGGDAAQEFGLRGTVDKDAAIVHVFPRRPAFRVCATSAANQRACMGISDFGMFCTGSDVPSVPEPPCQATRDEGMYFACVGGQRDNMPCTRDLHCKKKDSSAWFDGTCSRQPICRPKRTIWRYDPDEDPYPPGSTRCWTDSDCNVDEQCGYSLFDFGQRVSHPGLHVLDATIAAASTSGRTRRGACENDDRIACSNANSGSAPGRCPGNGRCRGYSLVAE